MWIRSYLSCCKTKKINNVEPELPLPILDESKYYKFNVTTTAPNQTRLITNNIDGIGYIYVDGVRLKDIPETYTFKDAGEHEVKYILEPDYYNEYILNIDWFDFNGEYDLNLTFCYKYENHIYDVYYSCYPIPDEGSFLIRYDDDNPIILSTLTLDEYMPFFIGDIYVNNIQISPDYFESTQINQGDIIKITGSQRTVLNNIQNLNDYHFTIITNRCDDITSGYNIDLILHDPSNVFIHDNYDNVYISDKHLYYYKKNFAIYNNLLIIHRECIR